MDGAGQTVFHCRIVNGIIAKGHVADYRVKIVIRKLRFFKSLRKYRGVGVEFLCYPGGDRVKFNTCPVSTAHRLRHTPEKMSNTHCWLKHFNVFTQSELFQSIPNCL